MLAISAGLACALVALIYDEPTHLGTWANSIHGLHRPVSVAVDSGNAIHIVESSAHRVRTFDRQGNQVAEWSPSSDPLVFPHGIAIAPNGLRFISDTGNHRIVVVDATGKRLRTIGKLGGSPGEFHTPMGLSATGDRLAVADRGNRRVQIFDYEGELLRCVNLPDDDRGAWPNDVLFGPSNMLAVLDGGRSRILGLQASQEELLWTSIGQFGFFPGTFAAPRGMGVSGSRLLVSDSENHRVQVFDFADLAQSALEAGDTPKPAYVLGIHAIRPREGRGKLHYPQDVAAAPDGSFAVLVEPWDGRAQIFERAPGARPEPDAQRKITGQASAHYGMHLASDGPIMVIVEPESAELLMHDIRQPNPEQRLPPILVARAGGRGDRLGLFREPTGLAVDYDRRELLVCDSGNRRLHALRFRHEPTGEIEQDFEMVSAIKMIDFQSPDAIGGRLLAWPVEPVAAAYSRDGGVFVLDRANALVHLLDGEWAYQGSFGGRGAMAGALMGPVDMAIDVKRETLFVADRMAGQVVRFSLVGGDAQAFGKGRLSAPHGITVAPDGRVYVSDSAAHCVVVFSPGGEELLRFGTQGITRGCFDSPRGLTFNQSGELVVLDHANHRGIVMTSEGEYVSAFGPRSYIRPAQKPESYREEDYRE